MGGILLHTPKIFWAFSVISVVVTLSLFFIIFTIEYTQRVAVSGKLEPAQGLAHITTPQTGFVAERKIQEGDYVKAGQLLFTISSDITTKLGGAAAATLQLQESRRLSLLRDLENSARLNAAGMAERQLHLKDLDTQQKQMVSEVDAQRRRVASAELSVEKYRALEHAGFAPAIQMLQKNDELLDQKGKLSSLERAYLQLDGQISSAKSELALQPMKDANQIAAIERQLSEIKQDIGETEAHRRIELVAPIDGKVTAIQASTGTAIGPGQILADIIPDKSVLVAHLMAPSNAIGFVKLGQRVQIRYQAFPYQKFGQYGGTIKEVSRTAIAGTLSASVAQSGPFYRITVLPDQQFVDAYGAQESLQADMDLDADVLLDRRTIIEWIFEPIIAIKGKL